MRCPNGRFDPACDVPADRYRAPVMTEVGLMRRHRCPNCRKVFLSLQKVISNWAAEKLLDRMETADSNRKPTPSSEEATVGETQVPTSETSAS